MPRIVVNDEDRTLQTTPSTWGDLIDALDRDLERSGLVVTSARLDGVDVPAFRDPVLRAHALGGSSTVELLVDTPRKLVERCLTEAADGLAELCDTAMQVGDLFRSADHAAANRGLLVLTEGLRALVTLVGTATQALRFDLHDLTAGGLPVAAHLRRLDQLVSDVIDAQRSEDWIAVADIIQYDIEPALRDWGPALKAIVARPA